MAVPAEKSVFFDGRNFKLHKIPYDGSATSFDVDQSATAVAVVEPASNQPTATLGAASNGLKTVSIAAGGGNLNAAVMVVVAHGQSVSSSKF
jgi:hypothetical protein